MRVEIAPARGRPATAYARVLTPRSYLATPALTAQEAAVMGDTSGFQPRLRSPAGRAYEHASPKAPCRWMLPVSTIGRSEACRADGFCAAGPHNRGATARASQAACRGHGIADLHRCRLRQRCPAPPERRPRP